MGRRVLMVAWDGTDHDLVRALLARGDLPVLAGLLAGGRWATLRTEPALSDVATWASFATGWDADRHGWVDVARLDPETYAIVRLFRRDVEGTPFWQHISDAGHTVTVLDVPKSPMGHDLQGAELVDWVSHMPDLVGHVHADPPELVDEVVARFGPDHGQECSLVRATDARDPVAAAEGRARQSLALTVDQLAARDADLVVTVIGSGHCVGHGVWHLHEGLDPGDPVADHYRLLDGVLGEIMEAAGAGWTTLVFSNRGMADYDSPDLTDEVLLRIGRPPANTRRRHGLVAAWQRWVPTRLRRALPDRWHRAARAGADAARSTRPWFAVPTGSRCGGIRVNLQGRERTGLVAPEDLDATLDRLAAAFEELVDVDTGEPAVTSVQRVADRWTGPHADRMPDLYVHWAQRPSRGVRSAGIGEVRRHRPGPRSGHHTAEGWLVAAGPGISAGADLDGLDVRDLGPTVGALLGVVIPDGDGRVVGELLDLDLAGADHVGGDHEDRPLPAGLR